MTRLHKTDNSHSRKTSALAAPTFLGVLLALTIAAGGAFAQTAAPEKGTGPESYQPAKTIDDYTVAERDGQDDFDYAANTLRVEVWTDKAQDDIYRKGEDLSVSFETNRDAYAVVYRIDTEGLVTVLWPRSRFDDGFVFGGHDYRLPVTGGRELRVGSSEGQGLVEAVVSQYPFDLRALELDFHHERAAETYDFRVAGDPFLAMNEVNHAVTGLEDAGEYVVTNYASYYVHQAVDHPRYLCGQCHTGDEVAYDPYRDECTLTIEYDYSWYNGWYDRYGYYPVYGNPVYVYVDPWTWSPWVNYWYRPYYRAAPWYGWGWGWGPCYSWSYSPYYRGDCVTVYHDGYRRYRPLDRTRLLDSRDGVATKTIERSLGSSMVRSRSVTESQRDAMVSRTRTDAVRGDRVASRGGVASAVRDYRGEAPKARSRQTFEQASRGSDRGGLRIRENVRVDGTTRLRTDANRHTAAGQGRTPTLAPVGNEDRWRGTTRVGGRSESSVRTIGGSRTGSSAASGSGSVGSSRSRSGTESKTVQPRTRSTRVWNSGGSSSSGNASRESSRVRSGSTSRDRSRSGGTTVQPRSNRSSGSSSKSGSSVRSRSSGSSGRSESSSSGSRSSGSRSSGSRSGGSGSSGSRSRDTGRR